MSLECWRGLTHGKYLFSPEFFLGGSCLHSFTDFFQVVSEVGSQISGAQVGKEKYFRYWKIVGLSPQARPGHFFFPLWLSPGGFAISNLNSLLGSVPAGIHSGPDPSVSICQKRVNIQHGPDSYCQSRLVLIGLSV